VPMEDNYMSSSNEPVLKAYNTEKLVTVIQDRWPVVQVSPAKAIYETVTVMGCRDPGPEWTHH
ncbi:hypothetical protein CRM22_000645, partial [Opisthorchis felineus]